LVLGEARTRSGHVDGGQLEWRAARSTFEAFGAPLWMERAEALAGAVDAPVHAPRDVADVAGPMFRRDGDTRTVRFGEQRVVVRDLLGFRYIERLLAEPGREFHALDLVSVEQNAGPTAASVPDDDSLSITDSGAGLPVLDDQAREAYRRRLAEVDEDIEDARRMNDLGRIALAERDREYLIAELTQATGLSGRQRTTGGSAERARTSVTRSIRYAVTRLAEHHPAISTHLRQTVKTGTYCTYEPDPLAPIDWQL
jgi:hypothetical protein